MYVLTREVTLRILLFSRTGLDSGQRDSRSPSRRGVELYDGPQISQDSLVLPEGDTSDDESILADGLRLPQTASPGRVTSGLLCLTRKVP